MRTRTKQWTINDYHRMIETGILRAIDRVELLDGQMIEMNPNCLPMPPRRHGPFTISIAG